LHPICSPYVSQKQPRGARSAHRNASQHGAQQGHVGHARMRTSAHLQPHHTPCMPRMHPVTASEMAPKGAPRRRPGGRARGRGRGRGRGGGRDRGRGRVAVEVAVGVEVEVEVAVDVDTSRSRSRSWSWSTCYNPCAHAAEKYFGNLAPLAFRRGAPSTGLIHWLISR